MSLLETADSELTPHPKPHAHHNGTNGHNGHEPANGHNLNLGQLTALPHGILETAEKEITADINLLRQQIRQRLIIFTETGSGRKLIDHDNIWHKAMEDINRLSISNATDPKAVEELGEQAKAIVIAAWQNKPALLRQQQIQELRKLAAGNSAARELILEELNRLNLPEILALIEKPNGTSGSSGSKSTGITPIDTYDVAYSC
jgi:hypothetical protein